MFLWFAGFSFEIENSPSVLKWDPPYVCYLLLGIWAPVRSLKQVRRAPIPKYPRTVSLGEIEGVTGTGQQDTFTYKVTVLWPAPASPDHLTMEFPQGLETARRSQGAEEY